MYDGTLKFDTSIDQSGFQLGLSNLGNIAKQGMAVIGSLVAGATAGIAALGTASVQTGMQFDAAMSQVGATLGYSVDQINDTASEAYRNMEMLTAKAEEMGAATSFSATQAANGLNILAQSGYSAAESVQMIDSVLNMAAAGNLSLEDAAKYVSGSMKGFTKEAGNFADNAEASAYYADIIAKGATLANTSVQALGEAMSEASSTANTYNQSAQATEVALLRLAEQNETGSAAATALAAAMKNLYSPTADAKAALDALGVSAYDANGKARNFNTVVDELKDALYQIDDESQRNDLENVIFGIQGQKAFDKMVSSSAEKVQSFYDSLEYTEDGAMGSAAQQAETMLDNLAGDVTKLKSAYEGFQIAISKNLDTPFREIVQKANEYMSDLTAILKARGLDGLAEALGDKLADALDFISGYIPGLTETGSKLILSLVNGFVKNLPSAAGTLTSTGKILISGFVKNLPDMAVTGMTVIQQLASGVEDNLPELISTGEELLTNFAESMQKKDLRFKRLGKSILKSLTSAISQNLPDLTEAVLNLINFLITAFSGNLSGIVNAAVTILLALADGLINSIPVLIEKAPEIISSLEQAIKDNAGLIKDSAGTILEKLGESLKNAKNKLEEKAPEIMQNVADALKNAPMSMASVATSIIDAIVDALGIAEKWEAVKTKISEVFENIDFEEIKLNLDLDVSQNFENVTQTLSEACDRLKDSFNNLKDSLDGLKEKFQPLLDTLKEYFTSGEAGEDASDALGTAITVVAGTIAVAADSISKLLSGMMDFAAWLAEGGAEAEAFSAAVIGIATTVGAFTAIHKVLFDLPITIAYAKRALTTMFAQMSASASGLWAVIAANPLTALLALLAGLTAALVYVSQTSEEWQLGWEMIKEAFQDFADEWNDYIDDIIVGWEIMKNGWDDFWNSWSTGVQTIKDGFNDFVDNIIIGWETMKNGWDDFWNSWSTGVQTIKDDFDNFIDSIIIGWETMKAGWDDFWDSWSTGVQTIKDGFNSFIDSITDSWDDFGDSWNTGVQTIKDTFSDFIDSMVTGWGTIKETFQDFANAWNTGFKEIKDKWEEFWNSWEIGEKTLEQFGESIYDFVEGARQWGKDLIDNFIGGVKEKWNDWEGTWEGVGEVIYDLLHHTHPDKGLLADDYTWMPDMMQSFSEGIKQNIPLVTSQAETLTENLHSILNDPVSVDVDFPEPENPKIKIEIPDLPEIENPELSLDMPSIDVPELAFNTPELPDFRLPELSPEAWKAFRIQSMRTPQVATPDAGSEIINNHYSYSTINNTQNQQNFQQNQPAGDIIIPVSIGSQHLETMVISAIQIENARSGGRTI